MKKITDDLLFLGVTDEKSDLFEGQYPVDGMTYNSYLLLDEKTVLFDTVDIAKGDDFLEMLDEGLAGRELDYIVINHMEPDHSAMVSAVMKKYKNALIVSSTKTKDMIFNFTGIDVSDRFTAVKDGSELNIGQHTLKFITCPMVHWPEVIMAYDETDKVLFSADAFGTFGTRQGKLFDDEMDFDSHIDLDRRYYTNIVGKYGVNVVTALKKAAAFDIQYICPLHGFIGRRDIGKMLDLYTKWATYTPEKKGVAIICASVYGNTLKACELLAENLKEKDVECELVYLNRQDSSYGIAAAFEYSNIVIASTTYNGLIFPAMDSFLCELVAHSIKNRRISVIENGSWAATSGKLMKAKMENAKDIEFVGEIVSIKSAMNDENREQILSLSEQIAQSLK